VCVAALAISRAGLRAGLDGWIGPNLPFWLTW
jgi:hypothetical protein